MAAKQGMMSTRSQVVDPVYEDFQPKSEWVENPASNVLTINLPGFTKDQIKVTYDEKPPRMTIRGERPLRNNVVSRFTKEFPIPSNCKLNEMRAKFDQREVLTIVMPKKNVAPTPENARPEDTAPKDQKPQSGAPSSPKKTGTDQIQPPPKPQEEKVSSPPKSSTAAATTAMGRELEKKTDEKVTAPTTTPQVPAAFPEPKTPKVSAETPSEAVRRKTADDQPFQPLNDKSRSKSENFREGTSSTPFPVTDASFNQKVKHREAEAHKEKGHLQSKESSPQVLGRIGKEAMDLAAAAKNAVVGMEERRLLVNAGVAVLVIVAIGAYVGYKLGSSRGSQTRD